MTIKLATDTGSPDTPQGESLQKLAEIIESRTKGTDDEIDVQVFYGGELGDQKEVFDLHIVGEIDMMINFPMTSYDSRMGVRNVPYMFVDWDQALDAYKPGGWLNTIYQDIYSDNGLRFFGAYPEGFAGVATADSYATNISEANNTKVRVTANFPNPSTLGAMGYTPVPMTFGEVYTSIQTGVVDGDAGNNIYWTYSYFKDVIDYYVDTRHYFVTAAISMNEKSWEDLDDNQKSIVAEAAEVISREQFENAQKTDAEYRKKAGNAGIKYIDLTEEQMSSMANEVRSDVWPILDKEYPKSLKQAIMENAPAI
ncbi:C4-dicarboxylate ABC transporter substrate-binding protein [Salinicola corii]|uniref:C4-dicarboxylate ABC transporter substrate-binding protein n=2 Tax=Salinicola corii TaxID=2606937 RepID=A0A640W842_9GAMM|nr:C4-dicarboxylate ABC transporter substrate-binding protein [Salinicola corii]